MQELKFNQQKKAMDKDNTGMYDNVLAGISWCAAAYFFIPANLPQEQAC